MKALAWLPNTIDKIVTTYTAPGDSVLLLAAPTPDGEPDGECGQATTAGRCQSVSGMPPGLIDAAETAARLGRPTEVRTADHVADARPAAAQPPAAPESADRPARRSADSPPTAHRLATPPDRPTGSGTDPVEAVIAIVDPHATDWILTLPWHALVTPTGILAFITHGDHVDGRWTDPSSLLAHTARHAGLAEIDRIALLEVPIRDGALASPAASWAAMTLTAPTGEPRHARVHSDLLIFAHPQPEEHGTKEGSR
ncbi:hypothetical protein [Streptantibioticus ferralitis]|uniref:Uncharacterized protein n=1 Tax=Streptantibioticus ferralitis TaxID=236510 RepID=A0ABT5Z3D0_9ACTN|nr:hypothetical protein [Streptantibioticus ferralitis]MDF2258338.1 hypothetical protein [Streptantibioticus ferralitis]